MDELLRSGSRELQELVGELREELGTVRREVYVILDANASPTRPIDAWLDRHDRARRQISIGCACQPRSFVHLEPQPVPEPVAEFLTVPTALNVVTRERIRLSPA